MVLSEPVPLTTCRLAPEIWIVGFLPTPSLTNLTYGSTDSSTSLSSVVRPANVPSLPSFPAGPSLPAFPSFPSAPSSVSVKPELQAPAVGVTTAVFPAVGTHSFVPPTAIALPAITSSKPTTTAATKPTPQRAFKSEWGNYNFGCQFSFGVRLHAREDSLYPAVGGERRRERIAGYEAVPRGYGQVTRDEGPIVVSLIGVVVAGVGEARSP